MAYAIATLGAVAAWAAAPGLVLNTVGIGLPIAMAGAASSGFFVMRRRLPVYAEDVAIVASLALLGVGIAYTARPSLFTPYYVWVGFSAPIWFPRPRAVTYLLLTVATCGADMALAGTAEALATWFVTTAILLVAFLVVQFLSRTLVANERLAVVGEMASAVGHELRNPLTSIGNALFLVRDSVGAEPHPALERHLALAERELSRAGRIAEDLLSLTRPRRPVATAFDAGGAIGTALASAPPPPEVRVEQRLQAATALADRDQVVQVLTNLLANAYQAMPGGGVLEVTVGLDRSRVTLSVADSGVGMDEALQARAFEPFVTSRSGGTGLGLAIVRRLVEDNGGGVEVHSTPGAGTRFTLWLPAAKAPTPGGRSDRSGVDTLEA